MDHPKRKHSSSNHPFSGAFVVSFRQRKNTMEILCRHLHSFTKRKSIHHVRWPPMNQPNTSQNRWDDNIWLDFGCQVHLPECVHHWSLTAKVYPWKNDAWKTILGFLLGQSGAIFRELLLVLLGRVAPMIPPSPPPVYGEIHSLAVQLPGV